MSFVARAVSIVVVSSFPLPIAWAVGACGGVANAGGASSTSTVDAAAEAEAAATEAGARDALASTPADADAEATAPIGSCYEDPPPEPSLVESLPFCCGASLADGGFPDVARCVPKAVVPFAGSGMAAFLSECSSLGGASGYCVPQKLAESGGKPPASCTAILGSEGACISACAVIPAGDRSLLAQGSCGGGELCVPCVNPLDGARTGACDIGTAGRCAP